LPDLAQILRLAHRTAIDRRLVGQRAIRNLGDDDTPLLNAQHAIIGDVADA
jgi:hypothetical protein